MEAPLDKVWIENNKIVWAYKPKSVETHEYVRKDAFIKDAVKWLKENASDYILYPIPELDESRLIENFKKHMEE